MKERRISEADIATVLTAPLASWPSKDAPDRTVFTGEAGGRRVGVVIVNGTSPVLVVTAWKED